MTSSLSSASADEPDTAGIAAVPELDPVIHAQARLRVTTTLATLPDGDRITFPRLQAVLEMTAGNLSTHLRRLEEAGYVEILKSHRDRTPVTHVSLTRRGRHRYEEYVDSLRALLGDRDGNGSTHGGRR